jgi:hypothetical protein
MMLMTLQDGMSELVGRCLSSIEFVQDYIQFRFDGPCLTTITLPSLRLGNATINPGNDGYADHLLSEIGKRISKVFVTTDELVVTFTNDAALVVSLRERDYRGAEALNYKSGAGQLYVV